MCWIEVTQARSAVSAYETKKRSCGSGIRAFSTKWRKRWISSNESLPAKSIPPAGPRSASGGHRSRAKNANEGSQESERRVVPSHASCLRGVKNLFRVDSDRGFVKCGTAVRGSNGTAAITSAANPPRSLQSASIREMGKRTVHPASRENVGWAQSAA